MTSSIKSSLKSRGCEGTVSRSLGLALRRSLVSKVRAVCVEARLQGGQETSWWRESQC